MEREMTRQFQVLAFGDEKTLCRPCVDCGLVTGRFCDYCYAEDRMPDEDWAPGQMTPLCSKCDNKHDRCHFCRGLSSSLAGGPSPQQGNDAGTKKEGVEAEEGTPLKEQAAKLKDDMASLASEVRTAYAAVVVHSAAA